jgi:hypothetical protein
MRVLVTGSSGLIGSEAVKFFDRPFLLPYRQQPAANFFADGTPDLLLYPGDVSSFRHLDLGIRNKRASRMLSPRSL